MTLLALLLLGPVPATKPPAPPAAEVVIQDRFLQLPGLPDSVAAAHQQYAAVLPQLVDGLKDVERELRGLMASGPASEPLTASLRVPPDQVEEANLLFEMLHGQVFDASFREVQKTWKAWQAFLAGQGLVEAAPAEGRAVPLAATLEEQALQKRLARVKWDQGVEWDRQDCIALATDPVSGAVDWEAVRQMMEGESTFRKAVATTQKLKMVANVEAPRLAVAWTPLVTHVNACARDWTALEARTVTTPSADMLRLRVHAKIRFLERFRVSLWFCQFIWAQMTANELPAPLKKITV